LNRGKTSLNPIHPNTAEKTFDNTSLGVIPRKMAEFILPLPSATSRLIHAIPKLIHYQYKFWKLSPAGYIIEDQDTHFVTNPNTSASTHARRERKRELYIKGNKKLTEEAIKQFNKEKERQATLSL
jgi:hypothetical protein